MAYAERLPVERDTLGCRKERLYTEHETSQHYKKKQKKINALETMVATRDPFPARSMPRQHVDSGLNSNLNNELMYR